MEGRVSGEGRAAAAAADGSRRVRGGEERAAEGQTAYIWERARRAMWPVAMAGCRDTTGASRRWFNN